MTWTEIVPANLPTINGGWALRDLQGRVFAITVDLQCAMAMRKILTHALSRVLSGDDTCPILIGSGLTRAGGELTAAGAAWIMHEIPTPMKGPN